MDCLLCNLEHSKGNLLSQELESGFTIQDAIKQYFTTHEQILASSAVSICMICFKTIKNFYEFTSPIDKHYATADLIAEEFPPEEYHEVPQFDPVYEEEVMSSEKVEEEIIEEYALEQETEIPLEEALVLTETEAATNSILPDGATPIAPQIIILSEVKEAEPKKSSKKPRRPHYRNDIEGDALIAEIVDLRCHVCHEKFDRYKDISEHFREVHPNTILFLTCCGRKFRKRCALIDHIEHHKKINVHYCQECCVEFTSKDSLRRHREKFHSGAVYRPEMCNDCGKFFTTKYTLQHHMKSHFVDTTKGYECYICKKKFKNLHLLLLHFKYRHDPVHKRSSVCHICSKVVTRLKIHMEQMHTVEGKERVKCTICGHNMKKFSYAAHLKKHKDDKPETCPICSKVLKNKATYKCHMKRNHTEGMYTCSTCSKSFHQIGYLQDHIACQHTGELLHSCRVEGCGKRFRNAGRRGVHEKRMHKHEYETKFKPLYLRQNVELVEYIDQTTNQEEVEQIVMEFEEVDA